MTGSRPTNGGTAGSVAPCSLEITEPMEGQPPGGSFLFSGKVAVDEVAQRLNVQIARAGFETVGGYLMTHAAEVERMAGNDYAKAERVKFAAWIKPASQRRQFINGVLQLNTNLICCFRAKEKLKLERGKDPEPQGWMPIETAPKDGTRILVCNKADYVYPARWQGVESGKPADWPQGWRDDVMFVAADGIVSWMQLPATPPKD